MSPALAHDSRPPDAHGAKRPATWGRRDARPGTEVPARRAPPARSVRAHARTIVVTPCDLVARAPPAARDATASRIQGDRDLMVDTAKTHVAAKRYIYAWGGGEAEGNGGMKDLLGGKGAGLAEMTNAGLPTPPGFTITTEACNDYFNAGEKLPAGLWEDVLEAVKAVEHQAGKGFGDAKNPLLVSVRSGAKFWMPGMMDTVLNLGLNEETLQGLVALTGNERFGWDAYRRFVSMFGRIEIGRASCRFGEPLDERKAKHGANAKDTDLNVEDLKALVGEFKAVGPC